MGLRKKLAKLTHAHRRKQSGARHPKFLRDKAKWLQQGGAITHSYPIVSDFEAAAGEASGHYFHQDLLVASLIFQNDPRRHIDIGSRIDGFVAHVAAFREIEIFDIRAWPSSRHKNIVFHQADLTKPLKHGVCDSVSCLHAIEHFGMGRYGDEIDVDGHLKGLLNIAALLEPGGTLYLSFPIGMRDEVHFNAHRVFHPKSVLSFPPIAEAFKLVRFDYVCDAGDLHCNAELDDIVGSVSHGCGIYTFLKIADGRKSREDCI